MKPSILLNLTIATAITGGSATAFAAARGGAARAVGAGLAFPSAHQSLSVNSGALTESGNLSMQGLYGFDSQEPSVSLVGSKQSFGWGLGWRDSGTANDFDAGFGLNLGGFLLGTTLYTTDFNGINGDVSATIELSSLRFVAAFRGIDDGIDRVDLGLGFNFGQALFAVDVYKLLPWSADSKYGFDLSLAYNAGKLGFGVGYDFTYLDGIQNGDLHADLSLALTTNFALEGHYRLTPYHSSAISGWSAGARLVF